MNRKIKRDNRITPQETVNHFLLIMFAVICLFPMLWMLSTSFKGQVEVYKSMSFIPEHFHWDNYIKAWKEGGFGIYFLNSVFYTLAVITGVLLIASLAAYSFARLEFKGKNILFYSFLAAMVIPIPGSFIPLYLILLKLGLANTRLGYILPIINANLPFAIFVLKSFFEEVPKELEEVSSLDGCSRFRFYWSVLLPLSKPALATVAIFTGLGVWNEFLLALLIFSDETLMPIQRALMSFQGQYITRQELMMTGTVIATLPVVIFYLFMQKNIISGIMKGALKG